MKENKILKRKRMDFALSNMLEYPLTVVSATMGYGKTTSVKTFLKDQDVKTIWVSVLGSQGIEDLFWNRLCAAIRVHYPDLANQLAELGFPFNQQQISNVVDAICEFKTEFKTVLVIDDYHLLEHNQMIGTLVELIAQEEFHHFHIVLLSRTRPSFNHTSLLAKDLCFYIDAKTLAFTLDDIQEYFNFMGMSLPVEELAGIEKYTDGWISAIYLIMLGIKEGLKTDASHSINQLVEENLFNLLDDQTKDAMLKLCICQNFTIKQAEVILDNKNIRPIIKQLFDKNAFIEYDKSTNSYKFHNVLLDYLRGKLDHQAEEIKVVYCRAGFWFAGHRDYVTAFDFYHRAGRVEELLEYLSRKKGVNITFLGSQMMLDIWNDLPNHFCVKYPLLFLQLALNFILTGDPQMIGRGIEIMTQIQTFYGKTEGIPPGLCDVIHAEIEVIHAMLAFNDIKKMLEHSKAATQLFHGGESSLILQHSEFTFGIPHFLYSYYTKPGTLKETVDSIVEGFPPAFFNGCGTGCDDLALAEYELEQGRLEQAEMAARKSIYKARTKTQISIELGANFTLMRKYLMEGKLSEAREALMNSSAILKRLDSEMPIQNRLVYNTTLDICEGFFYGCLKKLDSIPEWLREGDFSKGAFMFRGMAVPCIIYGKAILLSKNWIKLEVACESFQQEFNVFHNQFGLLYNIIFQAIAKYHLYGEEAGVQTLLPALKQGQEDGVIFMFAENADHIMPMLKLIEEKDGVAPEYLNKLMEFSSRYSNNLKELDGKRAVLTERETEVLKLLEEGMTQREIAKNLVLSASTVKRHLENIYQKLEVNNKIAAINSAKKLKII